MLVVCFTLLMGVTSCNSDDFEVNAPDGQKKLSNAELIEQALSRMPQTRAGAPYPVVMVTTKTTVTVGGKVIEDMVINWGDDATTSIPKGNFKSYTHTYSDNQPSHGIFLAGSNEAIMYLDVHNNEIMYLDVTGNTNLLDLTCSTNNLTELNLAGCPNLNMIYVAANDLTSIDVTHLPDLTVLVMSDNQLSNIDVSKNQRLSALDIGGNQITDVNLTRNTALTYISVRGFNLKTINNLPISSSSFAVFSKLQQLDVSYTHFTSLDFSSNPLVYGVDISGTEITQLNISNLQMEYLRATDSKLTNLTYMSNNLHYATSLKINGTPFEKLSSNLFPLITALPDRNSPDKYGFLTQGQLFTTSSTLVAPLLSLLKAKSWVVNPY